MPRTKRKQITARLYEIDSEHFLYVKPSADTVRAFVGGGWTMEELVVDKGDISSPSDGTVLIHTVDGLIVSPAPDDTNPLHAESWGDTLLTRLDIDNYLINVVDDQVVITKKY